MRKIIILLLFCFIFENSYSDEQNRTIKPHHKEVLIDLEIAMGRLIKRILNQLRLLFALSVIKVSKV